MKAKKEMAPTGKPRIDANTANGIQSKAVFKYTQLVRDILSHNVEILVCGWEAAIS